MSELFAFESDFVASLRCIPMAVRFKLDRAGIKLSLRQWSRFRREDRQTLLDTPCITDAEARTYRGLLELLVLARAGEPAAPLIEPPPEDWREAVVPDQVRSFAACLGVAPPADDTWASLPELRRFVLVKLSRDNHDNVNFVPAMREFGLI
ncbi:nitrate reductase associated protein [Phenylobacterium sp. J367]|uniref:nitrate reductase associated protein n=1 Tax=Phenylobacterium sp. J367 TaxID=2898435 RepID=UPI00215112D3|nr:nitrate reductase associated protein [Phenylobacterium sp. J367]MCR5879466.1 nitrate reductase associated protein [Phenylobacterium sp. J367]